MQVFDLDCHDYAKKRSENEPADSIGVLEEGLSELLRRVCDNVSLRLPHLWIPYVRDQCVHVMKLSSGAEIAVQRRLGFSSNGNVTLSVHCRPVPVQHYLQNMSTLTALSSDTIDCLCDSILENVAKIRLLEVCAGVDNTVYKNVWPFLNLGEIDRNIFQECRYLETFRSLSCNLLVQSTAWKCKECVKLLPVLKRKYQASQKDNFNPSVANKYLTDDQKFLKLNLQEQKINAYRRKMNSMLQNMGDLIEKESVALDNDLSKDLMNIAQSADLSPLQLMFLQQQVKASQKTNKCGMCWHPSMIRLALAIHLTSPATYELLRDTGAIHLPSSRTLFDYSHASTISEGIDAVALKSVAERVAAVPYDYQKYHFVMADEMHISKNLVFHKGTGELLGYMKLNTLDKEIKLFENYLDNPRKEYEFQQSTKMLTYMVKGFSNNIKEVIASFSVHWVFVNQMYIWMWEVITALEINGVRIIGFICDGSSTNRAFIKIHIPFTKTPSVVIFDTMNKVAPDRILYFFSDVPHLLKTIRNCFNNSRLGNKGKRCLRKNGEKIVWDTITNLYETKCHKTLRKSYKRNAQNVYPDSYSCMKVALAAQVMSQTVARDIEKETLKLKSIKTSETVKFIRYVNDWFDCLNGAHSEHGVRSNNRNLDPYRNVKDPTLGPDGPLLRFLAYLEEWKKEAEGPHHQLEASTASSTAECNALALSGEAVVEDTVEVDDSPAGRTQFSNQTLVGIEMSTRSFINATKFLLEEAKTKYINARVFCQDPLEQHFSKQRAGGGGSTNPNSNQFLHKQRAIHLLGQLGMKRKGNTKMSGGGLELNDEPLAKRKCLDPLQGQD